MYIFSKETNIFSKETYIFSKETFILSTHLCIEGSYTRKGYFYKKY